MRRSCFYLLAIAALFALSHGQVASTAGSDTIVLIKPEDVHLVPKELLERKLAEETNIKAVPVVAAIPIQPIKTEENTALPTQPVQQVVVVPRPTPQELVQTGTSGLPIVPVPIVGGGKIEELKEEPKAEERMKVSDRTEESSRHETLGFNEEEFLKKVEEDMKRARQQAMEKQKEETSKHREEENKRREDETKRREEEKHREEEEKKKNEEEKRREEEKRKEEEKKRNEEEKKKAEENMFKSYVAVGVVKLIFDNTTEPFTLFYDSETRRSRVDLGSRGLVRSIQLEDQDRMYRIEFPTKDSPSERAVCIEMLGTKERPIKVLKAIPDLDRFVHVGQDTLSGENTKVDRWEMEINDNKLSLLYTFKLFTELETKKPLRLEVFARSTKTDKIVDHYFVEFKHFFPTKPEESIFAKPNDVECRSAIGLLHVDEKEEKEISKNEDRKLSRHFVDNERLHMNPLGSLIDPDQLLAYNRDVDTLFEGFRRRFERRYKKAEEFELRRAAFLHNYRYVNLLNRAGLSFRLKLNEMADRTNDELRKKMGVHGIGEITSGEHGVKFDSHKHNIRGIDSLPRNIDWRILGALTPVVDQGECGSDWAIAATSVIESALFLRSNRLVKLSAQELLDCSDETGNRDCQHGTSWQAYEYVVKNGLSSETAYGPLNDRKSKCRGDVPISAKIKNWIRVTKDEDELRRAVATNGPVAAVIDAGHKSFFFYASGVYNEPNCRTDSSQVNHAVVIAGYGELNGHKYWLIENSFGEAWGLNGYMLIEADKNTCGIMSSPTFVDM